MFPTKIGCPRDSWIGICISILFTANVTFAAATPGSVDLTFNPGRGPNMVVGGDGQAILLQPDGRFLIGGRFNSVNLTKVAGIVRFNSSGSLDSSFNAPILPSADFIPSSVFSAPLALLANGQIIVGGTFDTVDGTHHHLVRLNANGSLDAAFNPKIAQSTGSGPPAVFRAVVQADGKILIGGVFDTVNNVARRSFARLNPNGSLDTAFNPNLGTVATFALQADGKILVARGLFGESLVRLNSTGTIDPTFDSHYVAPDGDDKIGSILIQSDGKIIVSGQTGFIPEEFNMARLNEDGSVDATFQSSASLGIALQRDGKILSYASGFVFQRLNPNGTFDSSFHPPLGALPAAIAEQPDGRLILAGGFFPAPYGIDRIFPNGSRDNSFVVGMGLTNIENVAVDHAQILPSGKIVIAGDFNHVNLLPRDRIAVLTSSGIPDASFNAGKVTVIKLFGFDVDNPVNALAVQPDGKILIGFYNRVVRLNQNGSVDPTFNYHPPSLAPPAAIAVQNDGKILVGNGDGLIRLQYDGSLDSTFNAGAAGGGVSQLLLQPDGKIIISRRGLIRLNQNGSLDPSFHSGFGEFNFAIPLALLPDGKVLVNYLVSSIDGLLLVRLNEDGSRDNSFNALAGVAASIAVDQSSIYVINNGVVRRLELDGTIDPNFNVQLSADAELKRLLLQVNGQLIIAGNFDKVNNVVRNSIARLIGNAPQKAANISTRARVGNGEAVEIGGFIIQGTARKKVLIRGLGPSIQTNGMPLPGTLADPVLELHHSSGSLIRFNDNWRDFQPGEILDTGLAPTKEEESVISAALLPDEYTAVLRGKNNGTGVALVEIYDLDPAADSRLANISTRGSVGTGDNVLIGGFIFRGPEPARLVIRAMGPSLKAAEIASPLADPKLELHNQSGELVAANDNWKQTQQSELLISGLAPNDDRESAIIATLQTGAYTAVVRGSNSGTGIALVEVYDIR